MLCVVVASVGAAVPAAVTGVGVAAAGTAAAAVMDTVVADYGAPAGAVAD